jgi:hypothetical protein
MNIASGVSQRYMGLVANEDAALEFLKKYCESVPAYLHDRTNGAGCVSKLEVSMLVAEIDSEACIRALEFPRCVDRNSAVMLNHKCFADMYSMLSNETVTLLHEHAAALHTECQKHTTEVRSTCHLAKKRTKEKRLLARKQAMLPTWHTRVCRQAATLLMDQCG